MSNELEKEFDATGVGRRLSLTFGALLLSLMLAVLLSVGLYLKNVMERERDNTGSILTQVLASSVNRISFSGKYHTRLLLEEIKESQPGIRYLLLAEPDGRVLAHSNRELNDAMLPENDKAIIQQVLRDGKPHSRHTRFNGEPIHEITLPYRGGYDNSVIGVIQLGLSEQQRDAALRNGIIFIAILILVLLTLGIFLTRRISAHFGKPVKELAADLAATLHTVPDLLFELDHDGRFLRVPAEKEDKLYLPRDQVLGRTIDEILPPQAVAVTHQALTEAKATGESFGHQILLPIGGSGRWFELSIARKEGTSRFVVLSHDVTERKQMMHDLQALADHNRLILDSAGEGIFGLDSNGVMTFVNPAAATMLGYTPDELIGGISHNTWHHHHKDGRNYDELDCPIFTTLSKGEKHSGEEHFIRRDGVHFPVSYSSTPIIEAGKISGAVVTFTDISEKKAAEERIHHLAYFDALTDLPNRTLLAERLSQTVVNSRRAKQQGALILINLDRFKNINDALGQATGDKLLITLAHRLTTIVREGCTLARIAGDEFAVLVPVLGTTPAEASHSVHTLAERIHSKIRQPLVLDEAEVSCTVSLGISLYPESEQDDVEAVFRRADTALHRAKANGGNQSAFFETDMGEAVEQRFRIERELRQALPAGELSLYLQPQVDATRNVVAAEVLLRWNHPDRGLVPPGVFIPIAEESDLIIELGNWVLARAFDLLVRCDMAGKPIPLSVNLSPRQFRQPGFTPWLKDLISSTGADPSHLTLEVTEGLVIEDINDVVAKMGELTNMGIHFSIDDFGTGYSSLAYLKRLPIHELKIDKAFIRDAPQNESDAALVETIMAVAKHMHLRVVAEGVETEEQADFLNQRGRVIHQGYLFGKPEPAEDWIARWLDEN